MSNLTPGPDHAVGVDPTEPVDAPSFFAKSKKALAGGFAGAVTAAGSALTLAAADGITTEEWWGVLSLTLGGFVVGFAGVWAAPKNAG